jgi:putative ATP-dependent endonuclease of the OLD family
LYAPTIANKKEKETFDAYSTDVNSLLFFADKVIFVEGESDLRVIRLLLEKKLGSEAHRISLISAAGNQNFSPFLRMTRAWRNAKIPHLVITDFDSLTTSTDRAMIVGAEAAGYTLSAKATLQAQVDAALDRDEVAFNAAAKEASKHFANAGLNVFVFNSDLEYSLMTSVNKDAVAKILTSLATNGVNYNVGYDLNQLRRLVGSKGVPINPAAQPPFKRPFVHRKIAETIDLASAHPDISRLLSAVEDL